MPSIFILLSMYCSEFIFKESDLPSDLHTNTVNFSPICKSTQNAARGAIFLRIVDYDWRQEKTQLLQWNPYLKTLELYSRSNDENLADRT